MCKLLIVLLVLFASCHSPFVLRTSTPSSNSISGSQFYKSVASISRDDREALAVKEILSGNIPSFIKRMVKINTSIIDSSGKTIKAYYYAMPDYLSIGSDDDFARIPLTPISAQKIADSLNCFLPTRKIVNDIYKQAVVKLEPMPMYAFRDSAPTFYHHHLIIEGQRKGKKGLIAGIKKDVVISDKLTRDTKKNRVAIYGWYKPDGKPIQPLYTGHVDWYVDYSHGIRLIHRTIWVEGKAMDYIDVMKDKVLKRLLCDEDACDVYRY
ncbi:MAG TPA: hypothetical protein VF622_06550 [Segetibacter sp.]|jgi:hypothetical protein